MKKIILTLIVLTFATSSTFSQKWENYLQFNVGTGYLMDANFSDTPLLQFEYGKTLNWFDLALALEYANTSTYGGEYTSLLLKTKFDIVRMFVQNSKHSFKLGLGAGIGTTELGSWHNSESKGYLYSITSTNASYEYEISGKTWLGLFFNNYPEDIFFGLNYLGLSIRHNF
jgi:hypothetical protein